ncbi:MAG: C10 family peptidase [Kiritimatiellae bacterium]|nr:C10 family peptidase [Kiritimatiellia bacterium]
MSIVSFFKKPVQKSAIFALLAIFGVFFARAEFVSEATARGAAEGFLAQSSVAKKILAGRSVDSVEAYGSLWIVHLAPSGYIEVSGSTKCSPIVSFSTDDFSEPEVGTPFAAKLASDSAWVDEKEADESAEDNAQWSKLTSTKTKLLLTATRGTLPTGTDGTGYDPYVAPFLGATWHQTAPYNDLSPYNYFCGCMATAAGQELRYWRWPYRCEKFRYSAHGVRDAQNNYYTLNLHLNGLVPFDWDKIKSHYRDESNASTPWANDKQSTYNAAYLTLWAQSLTGMGYKPGGSGGTQQLASNAEIFGYEKGRVYTYGRDGYDNLWAAVKADLDWGSPIQINTAAHQMVIDGYAVENNGEEDEIDYINLNLGYGNAVYWTNLKDAVTTGTYSGVLAAFQTGFRPQKIVQFEPLPKVSTSDVTLKWHIAPCYTNRTIGFTIEIAKAGGDTINDTINTHEEMTTYTATGLDVGGAYTFTVTPMMSDASEARANSVTTTIGEPKAAPEFLNVSSVACGIELLQQDIFIECAYGQVNDIKVTCSESTTSLTPYSSHTTIIPDEKISVTQNGNVFTVSVDAIDMLSRWNVDGEMILLTLVAKNEDGTEAYKNLMLRFNSMRQVINGTFDAAEGDSNSAVWFCGDTTIDAKGRAVSFGPSAFQGTGKVTLTDSVGGGSFTFASLDNFRGTLVFTSDCSVTLPEDMTKFEGTLSITSGTYTLSNDLSDSAKVIIAEGVTVNLDNVNVASTITGGGTINISSGSSVLSGAVTSSVTVKLFGGELTIPAGTSDYSPVAVGGGTLKIQLSKAQSILGYDWWLPLYTSGIVKFVLYDGTEVNATTTSATPGIKIAHSSEANVWTGTDYATFGETYSAKWSNGLPNEGDYVIFKSELNDWMETGTSEGTMMALNLTSPRNLGYVLVKGTDKLEIGVYKNSTSALLSTDVLENEVETHITTSYFQPKTVIPRKKLSTSSGFILSCELDSTYADNLKKHETGGSSLPDANYWRGTVVFCNRNISSLELPNYGNAQSKIRFNGVAGSIRGDGTFAGTMELVDYGETPALNLSSGNSSYPLIIGSVTGTGMFKTSGSANTLNILLKDISGWTGSFDLASKTIAIGSATPTSYTGNDGKLHICQAATVAEGATWAAAGGLYLGAGGALTINGAVETKNVTTYGAGASITLEDDAVLQVSAASVNDYNPTLNFKAGTYRVKEGADAFRETATINFCAAAGKCTTLDANGKVMTLGPNFFSGAGDVYLTSSKSDGAFVLQGLPAAYTGTIYADISAGVTLSGDLSQTTGKISISDIGLTIDSANLGNVVVGSGATLTVVLTDRQAMDTFAAAGVTLSGGTIAFADKRGKVITTSTTNTTYTRPADYKVPSAVPIAVWTGDFDTTFDTCSLNWHDNTFANGAITINDGFQGVDVNLASGAKTITVIVKYSNLAYSSSNGRVFFTSCADSGKTYDRTALRLTTGNAIMGSYNGSTSSGTAETDHSNGTGVPPASGYMVFSYGDDSVANTATMLYSGSAEGSLNNTNFWNSSLKYAADSNNTSIYGATIGGYRQQATQNTWKNATGMKIEAIAVFTRSLDADERDFYTFPKPPELTVLPATGTSVEWGAELTAAYDDATATIWYKKYGDADYTQYTEPVALTTSGTNFYYFHVKDADGTVVVEDTLFTYIVGNPPGVTFTVEVPENMTVTVDGEAYAANTELTRTVGDTVTIEYTVAGAFVGADQSQTVTIAADTTSIGVPAGYIAPVAAVAQIVGGDYYASLQAAIDAANASEAEAVEISLLLASSENVSLAGKITITETAANQYTGTLSGSGTLTLAGVRSSAMSFGEWTGTVELPDALAGIGSDFHFNYHGKSGSTVRLASNVAGWIQRESSSQPAVINPAIEIPEGKTLTITGFSPSFKYNLNVLKGAGTFAVTAVADANNLLGNAATWTYDYSAYILVNDVSAFNGTLTVTGDAGIAVGSARPSKNTVGGKILLTSADATLAATATPEPETTVAGSYVKKVEGVYSLESYKTITFKNHDETTLYTITTAKLGDMPEYVGDTPTKDATAQYTYTFDGWAPEIVAVTGDAIYTAKFTQVEKTTPTGDGAYPVPHSWFIGYDDELTTDEAIAEKAETKAANNKNTWWECYVLGLDPTKADEEFKVTITMDGQTPVVTYSPTNETLKVSGDIEYILQGKPKLTDDFENCESFDEPGEDNRFFRVKVQWPPR